MAEGGAAILTNRARGIQGIDDLLHVRYDTAWVFRDPNEDDRIWVVFDMDEESYNNLMSDPEMPEVFQAAGLQGRPQTAESGGQTDF